MNASDFFIHVPCSHVNYNGFNLPEMIVSLIRQQLLSFGRRPEGSEGENR